MKYIHDVKVVNVSDIEPNKYNPNQMDHARFTTLRKEIREEGFLQPLLLRANPNKKGKQYIIIDGEHRWKAAKSEGLTEVPAIIVNKDVPQSQIATINMNRLRGEFDSVKLAHLIVDLNKTYSVEELEDKLGIVGSEIEGLKSLIDVDLPDVNDVGLDLDQPKTDVEEQKIKMTFEFDEDDLKIVQKALELTNIPDDTNRAMKFICLEYIAANGKQTT